MHRFTLKALVAMAILSLNPVFAGEITDNYSTGDTLTASKLDNIKSAVNDNNAEVGVLEQRIADLEIMVTQQFDTIQALLACIDPSSNASQVIFDGCNIHIRNGDNLSNSQNMVGNLIIGYNEDAGNLHSRLGSHNLIIGAEHDYNDNSAVIAGNSSASFKMDAGAIDISADALQLESNLNDITLVSRLSDIVLESIVGRITIESASRTEISTGSTSLTLEPSLASLDAAAGDFNFSLDFDLGAPSISIGASAILALNGGSTSINGGSTPAAGLGSIVTVTGLGNSGIPLILNATITSSPNATVLIP